jgi:hypothetical protein
MLYIYYAGELLKTIFPKKNLREIEIEMGQYTRNYSNLLVGECDKIRHETLNQLLADHPSLPTNRYYLCGSSLEIPATAKDLSLPKHQKELQSIFDNDHKEQHENLLVVIDEVKKISWTLNLLQLLDCLMSSGRIVNIGLFISVTSVVDLKPQHRGNLDCIYLCCETSQQQYRLAYKYFSCGGFKSFEDFMQHVNSKESV